MTDNSEICEMVATKTGLTPLNQEHFESVYVPGERYRIKPMKRYNSASKEAYGYFGFLCTWLTKNTLAFAGWRPVAVRNFAKTKFAGEAMSVQLPNGEVLDYIQTPSSAALDKKEFHRMLNEFIAWLGTELQITVPEPNQSEFDKYHHVANSSLDHLNDDYGKF